MLYIYKHPQAHYITHTHPSLNARYMTRVARLDGHCWAAPQLVEDVINVDQQCRLEYPKEANR